MAKDLKAFLARMKEDPAFAEEIKAKCKSIAEAVMTSDKRELLIKVGEELGYEFSVDDLEINVDENRELSDDELEQAAGGFWAEIYEFFVEAMRVYYEPTTPGSIMSG